MSTAVALFVDYPLVPKAIRDHGRQPGFAYGHCMLIRPVGSYTPGWLDEFASEPGPITDCVPATGVRGVNFMTHGAQAPTTPAEREALQNAMGTQDAGADEVQLASGITKRYGRQLPYGKDWAAIVKAIGAETTPVIVGDPLSSSDYSSVPLGTLKPASAGLGYRYVLFTEQATLPDTSSEDPMANILPFGPARVHISSINVFAEPRLSLVPVAQGGPFLYRTGEVDVTVIGQAKGDPYQGDATWLVYLSSEGGPIYFPKASAGAITPLGGITQAQLDAAVKTAKHAAATATANAAVTVAKTFP